MLRKDFAPLGADHNEGGKINWAELFPLKVFSFTLNNYMWQLHGINYCKTQFHIKLSTQISIWNIKILH